MFNKVLVVVDESVDIQNNEALMQAFAENFDAEYSLHFSKGPMDILDHSSSKFAFGSKLGIDLTKPFPVELDSPEKKKLNVEFSIDALNGIQKITDAKSLWNEFSAPILLLNVKKDSGFKKEKLITKLEQTLGILVFKVVLIFNEGADLNDLFMLMWLLGGNIEPERDVSLFTVENESRVVFVDATFKTGIHDNFKRDWPNIVTMDDKTISTIDNKWDEMGLGNFIESPSLKFKSLVKGNGAIRE